MSEKLCTLRTQGGGGGAKQVETVLWTNSAPTSEFNAQTITLSDSIDNYDYIKIIYKVYADAATNPINEVIIPVDKLKSTSISSSTACLGLNMTATVSGTPYQWSRSVYYASSTTISFTTARTVGGSTTNNSRAIPTQIVGIKNMGGKIDNKTVSGSVSVTAGGATSTIDVGFRPKKLYVYANISSNGIINCSYDESISATTYIRGMKYGSSNLLVAMSNFGGTNNGIHAIEDNGFKLFNNMSQLAGTWYYTAVKG